MPSYGPWVSVPGTRSGYVDAPDSQITHRSATTGIALLQGGTLTLKSGPFPAQSMKSATVHQSAAYAPMWPGMWPVGPSSITDGDAIGYQLRVSTSTSVSPVFLDYLACFRNGAMALYNAWAAADGDAQFTAWRREHYVPADSLTMECVVNTAGASANVSWQVGVTSSVVWAPMENDPNGASDFVAPLSESIPDMTVLVSGGPLTSNTSFFVDVDITMLITLHGFDGHLLTPTIRTNVAPTSGTNYAYLRASARAVVPYNDYRWVYAAVSGPSPLRQSGRTDGLIGAPRQGPAALTPQIRQGRSLMR